MSHHEREIDNVGCTRFQMHDAIISITTRTSTSINILRLKQCESKAKQVKSKEKRSSVRFCCLLTGACKYVCQRCYGYLFSANYFSSRLAKDTFDRLDPPFIFHFIFT